ncbi:MAG: alanine racemase, partial [Bacteroidota bacterium]
IQYQNWRLNTSPESFSALVRYKLEPEIYSFNIHEEWMRFIRYEKQNLIPAVHLKLDTGMHRLGFREHEIEKLVERLKESPIQIASLLTHLAAADDPKEHDYTHEQVAKFQRMADSIESHLHYKPLRHALNSAGISRFPDYQFDMVRLGIGLYGIEAGGKYQTELESISTLKTVISQVKTLKAGDTVSYGRHGKVLKDDTKIATVSIGYADGYPRHFSNGVGMMYVRDRLVPVIGNICMDMCMLDVSEVDNVQEGDEVIVFGEHISLFDAAKAIETIPYEILTNIGGRVRRVFFES